MQVPRQHRGAKGPQISPADRLHALRAARGAEAVREQRALLRQVAALRLRTWRETCRLHDDLLFLCAFPAALAVRRDAQRLLRSISRRVIALPHAERARADDSGIAGSTTRHVYPLPIARWLARRQDAEIEWRDVGDAASLDRVVGALLAPSEREAFDGGEHGTRAFVALARPRDARSDLAWLATAPARAADDWDAAEASVAWKLRDSRESVSRNALTVASVVARSSMRRPAPDAASQIVAPLESIERLEGRQAMRVVEVARAALAARCREVNAITYPNLDEVWWCDLGEGTALAVIGIAPAHRLTLETNTGYALFANGMPIGYGGVTPLFRQANTGINVFDAYRGGEASYLWVQMLRAFRTLYGSGRFVVNPYQFGAGNAEAIRSGAFWFYYRLGFRPALAPARALAQREARRLESDRKYRSDAVTLRALASCDLHLDLPGFDPADHFDEPLIAMAGARAAQALAAVGGSTRLGRQRSLALALARDLRVTDLDQWPAAERRGFEAMAPIFAGLPSDAWSATDRESLASALRAKGLAQERSYALRSTRAAAAFRALRDSLRNVRR